MVNSALGYISSRVTTVQSGDKEHPLILYQPLPKQSGWVRGPEGQKS